VRMPANNLALELLEETGPLAVSSANLTGQSAAITAAHAKDMLGDSVAVYLDGGPSETGIASTIVDATSLVGGSAPLVRVLREGAVTREALREVLGDLLEPDPVREETPAPGPVLEETPAPDPVREETPAPESTA
jgi:L-threonylcarbamoyladenylate synthase